MLNEPKSHNAPDTYIQLVEHEAAYHLSFKITFSSDTERESQRAEDEKRAAAYALRIRKNKKP